MTNKKIVIVCLPEARKRYRFVYEPLLLTRHATRLFVDQGSILFFIVRALKFAVKNRPTDITIIFGGDFKNLVWFAISKFIFKSKIVMRLGGDPFAVRQSEMIRFRSQKRSLNYYKLLINFFITKWLVGKIRYFIVVSKNLDQVVTDNAGHKNISAIIPQYIEPLNLTASKKANTRIKILTVTNLNYGEKYDALKIIIDYFYKNTDKFDRPLTLDIVGGGFYFTKISDYLSGLNRDTSDFSIIAHGYLQNPEPFYRNADIFLYCSTLDSLPNVLLEAKAHRLPVIVNRYPALTDIFHENRSACFFDIDNEDEFISKVVKLVTNDELRLKLGRANRDDIQNSFSKANISKKLDHFLKSI